jgi:ADP-heptose:LPS heptosyltransferase/GT2 family glycosyltransferase
LHFVTVGARQGLKTHRNGESAAVPAIADMPQEPDGLLLGIDTVTIDRMSDGSLQFRMRGWAIVDEPIAQISLSLGEIVLGYAAFGLSRPDVAAKHPDHPKADHCGYSLTVDALPDGLSGNLDLSLTVELAGGVRCPRPFSFDMNTAQVTRKLTARERAPSSPSRRPWTAPPLRLEVDEIDVNPRGVLEVSGWAVCFLDIVAIKIFVGDSCLGVAEYGRVREDVASACPDYPRARRSGFYFKGPIGHCGPGRNTVKVQVLTQSGTSRESVFPIVIPEGAAVPVDAEAVHLHCDTVSLTTRGGVAIEGWAVCPAPTESIGIRIDDAAVGLAQLGIERPDVGNIFNHFPHARQAGFSFRQYLNIPLALGEHVLTLRLKDKAGGIREMPLLVHAVESNEEVPPSAAVAPGSDPDLAISMDLPKIVNGAAEDSVISSLSIAGWALARTGVKAINIAVDGKHLSTAHYGVRREDVATAFPARADALMSGFAALIPNWLLPKGSHRMSISVVDSEDKSAAAEFDIQVEEVAEGDGPWALRRKMPHSELELNTRILSGLKWRPRFRLLVKMLDSEGGLARARATLASLREQAYVDWEALIIVENRRTIPVSLRKSLLAGFEDLSTQVELFSGKRSALLAAAAASSKSTQMARPMFISALTAGDALGCDALMELAVSTGMERDGADFFYTDERRISPVTKMTDAYFKPGWSPDLLLSTNYVGRLWFAHADLLERSAVTIEDWLDKGDYELVLRTTEQAKTVHHIPKVLCERSSANSEAAALEKVALERTLQRRGVKAKVKKGCVPGIYHVKRKRITQGLVSIIIPTCAGAGRVKTCLETLKEKTAYRNFEIICIENIPVEKADWKIWLRENANQVIETFEPFNWSRYNNLCAARASGEFFLFLNDDIEIIEPNWLDTLLEQAERPEVGVAGPQLLYGDRSVQHAGLALTALGTARHVFRHAQPDDPGYFGLALTARNVIGVTGACLLTRRVVFDAVGRFDEAHTIVNNDLDYCLKTWRAGYLNIYTPHAQLIHHELASRGEMGDDYDSSAFVGEWRDTFIKGDPYLNPNISRNFDDLSHEREPVNVVSAGHPLMARDAVHKILVVKLDHIGDCLTALPALRRLKEHFPNAQFSALAGRATQAFWTSEASVEETHEFNFFHARSGLGKKDLTEDELLELRQRMEPLRFDLAVDLRKSLDTRYILKYTGAKYLAGFDSRRECPWLDISLEWEGDTRYVPKRQHVADDLLNLVDAVASSCTAERSVLTVDPKVRLTLRPLEYREIFSKPVVCIHPASGTEMRQWPPDYFGELIDLLITHYDLHIVILGGPDELNIAQNVLSAVRHPKGVFSLVGKLKLGEVPTLISKCTLFVGNNSGPHHIAGALGVPTIGVHSGVVDSMEWGPLGDNALAIRRNMSCSPCYIEKRGDCPKNLACIRGLGPYAVYEVAARLLAIRGRAEPRVRLNKPTPSRPQHEL